MVGRDGISEKTGTINSEFVSYERFCRSKQLRKRIFIARVLSLSQLRPFIHYQIIVVAFNLVIKSSKFGPEAARVEFIAFNGPHGTDDWLKFERNASTLSES